MDQASITCDQYSNIKISFKGPSTQSTVVKYPNFHIDPEPAWSDF